MNNKTLFIMLLLIHNIYAKTIEQKNQATNTTRLQTNSPICQVGQPCRANICIYNCYFADSNLSFIQYIMYNVDIHKAYATRLEIINFKEPLLAELPKNDTQYQEDSVIVKYKWENQHTLTILLYENKNIVGKLVFQKIGDNVIIYDNLHL